MTQQHLPRFRLSTLFAGLLALSAGSSAVAQSSVTLWGIVDLAYRHTSTSGVGSFNGLVSGAYQTSRWAIKGVEDLGGGKQASFWLESQIAADTGTSSDFSRRSTLSLTDRDLGELRMGRDYTPTHWARFDPFGFVGIGSVQQLTINASGNTVLKSAFGSNPNTVQRVSNSVQYLLPKNNLGFDGNVQYSFKEGGLASNDQHRAYGARLGYRWDKLYVSGATMRTNDSNITNGSFKDNELGAIYDASVVKVYAAARKYEYLDASQTMTLLAAEAPFGPHEVKAMWMRAKGGGTIGAANLDSNRADQFSLGYVYNFSKNTRLFATYATVRNKGGSRFAVLGALATTANGQSSSGFEAGMNKSF